MSIEFVHELLTSDSASSDVSSAGSATQRRYFRDFHVLTTEYTELATTVSLATDPVTGLAVPRPFETYDKGVGDDTVVCTKMKVERVPNQPLLWFVRVTYTSHPGWNRGGLQDGDVTAYLPGVRTWKIPYQETIWEGRRQLVGTTPASPVKSYAFAMARAREPIANSVGKPYANEIYTQKHCLGIELRVNQFYYDLGQADDFCDTVNEKRFWGRNPGTVKMVTIGGERRSIQDVIFWLVTYEFHIKKDGWAEEIPDNGFERWCKDDGSKAASIGEVTKQCKITDGTGAPLSWPSYLDGRGYEEIAGVSDVIDPFAKPYLVRWHHLEEKDFTDLMLPTPTQLAIVQ